VDANFSRLAMNYPTFGWKNTGPRFILRSTQRRLEIGPGDAAGSGHHRWQMRVRVSICPVARAVGLRPNGAMDYFFIIGLCRISTHVVAAQSTLRLKGR